MWSYDRYNNDRGITKPIKIHKISNVNKFVELDT